MSDIEEGLTVQHWGWRRFEGGEAEDGTPRVAKVWRFTWAERPGYVAHLTGPADADVALAKASRVVTRLPWEVDPEADPGVFGLRSVR